MQNNAMDIPQGTPVRHRGVGRYGGALVLTMVVVMGLVALVSIAADHMIASHKLSMLNLDRQRARISAETIAAMVESRLVELASTPNPDSSELDNLSRDFQSVQDRWWGLRGACYSDGATYRQASQGLWLNGCVVRWRIEPVRVYAQTLDVQGVASGVFTVNTEPDPAKSEDRKTRVGETTLSPDDPGFFHFRIVAEAHTLEDPRNGDEQPWVARSVTRPQVAVQAQRVVQLQLINLFKYALFHAQEDARGDIDLQTGASLTILKGSVHSNASIYIRGGENNGFTQKPRNYHQMASGDDGHNTDGMQFITLGSQAEPIDVVGVNGIFRMGKTANILLGVDDTTKVQFANPLNVPVSEPTGNSDHLNLNGDGSASKRHNINGVPFILANDSRTPSKLQADFQGRVRDKNNGGTVVKTLANIPELAGRPLEFQQLATSADRLFRGGTLYTRIRPDATATPLHYVGNPAVAPTTVDDNDPNQDSLSAEGARLYWNATYTTTDVDIVRERNLRTPSLDADFRGRPLTVDATSAIAATHSFPAASLGDGFDDREVKGYYLERGLLGRGLSSTMYYTSPPATIPKTGLVIRERPRQTILVNGALGTMARPKLPVAHSAADFIEHRKQYAAYLKSQYVVLFSGRNITESFFNQILSAAENANYAEADFIVTEDEFIDSRESSWMAANYGVVPKDYFGVGSTSYRQNVLTLNMRRIQDFLRNTAGDTIDPNFDTALAKTRFNGLIYVHRTRRSQTYHPTESAHHAWIAPNGTASNLPFVGKYTFPQVVDQASGLTITPLNYNHLTDIREGHGPLETSRCAVRIRGGLDVDGGDGDASTDQGRKLHASIDWNASGGPDPLGTSGLSIVTPDRCYLWGDFNTTTTPDDQGVPQVVPCAVFADGITALSANWKDSLWQHYTKWSSGPERTYGATTERFAISTKYITSVVVNNVPNADWNVSSFGTGGTADTIRLLEVWSGKKFTFRGSMVVLNEQRYSRCGHFYTASTLSNNVRVFETGEVEFTFNTDLLTRNGQPPFSPWGFQVTRVVSTVNVFNN